MKNPLTDYRNWGGPLEAILDTQYKEYLYATLCAWGIHRMGREAGRLVEFGKFCQEIETLSPYLGRLQGLYLSELTAQEVEDTTHMLWNLIESMRIRPVDKPYLVPATKALHHILPELVVPVDGQYTAAFFGWSRNELLNRPRDMFFKVFPTLADIAKRIKPQVSSYAGQPFHRTLAKIVDNAIAGFVISERENARVATNKTGYNLEESGLPGTSTSTVLGSSTTDADKIRQKALELHLQPARQQGLKEVTIICADLHHEVGLHNRYRNVCQALAGSRLSLMANVELLRQEGPRDSSTTRFTYRLL